MEFLTYLRELITQEANAEVAQNVIASIIGQFSGETIYIRADSTKIRNERIKDDFARGLKVEKLASRYFLSSRTIKRILKD